VAHVPGGAVEVRDSPLVVSLPEQALDGLLRASAASAQPAARAALGAAERGRRDDLSRRGASL